MHKLCKQYHRV